MYCYHSIIQTCPFPQKISINSIVLAFYHEVCAYNSSAVYITCTLPQFSHKVKHTLVIFGVYYYIISYCLVHIVQFLSPYVTDDVTLHHSQSSCHISMQAKSIPAVNKTRLGTTWAVHQSIMSNTLRKTTI